MPWLAPVSAEWVICMGLAWAGRDPMGWRSVVSERCKRRAWSSPAWGSYGRVGES